MRVQRVANGARLISFTLAIFLDITWRRPTIRGDYFWPTEAVIAHRYSRSCSRDECCADGQQVLGLPVSQELTKLKNWVNDEGEPDNVIVAVG